MKRRNSKELGPRKNKRAFYQQPAEDIVMEQLTPKMKTLAVSRRAPKNGRRLTRFVFTLNNWTEDEYHWLTKDLDFLEKVRWMVVARETGENGTPHLQGGCCLKTQTAFSTVKTWPGFSRCHIEPMKGKPQDSLAYCSKQDTNPWQFGTLPQPGKRTDIDKVVKDIKAGKSIKQIVRESDDGAVAVVKYFRGFTQLRALMTVPRTNAPMVFWLHGATGTGKSRLAFAFSQLLAGTLDNVYMNTTFKWFDGYHGQDVAFFDDFRAKDTKFNFLLRVLDRYPLQTEVKGGFCEFRPKYIFITTSKSIEKVFFNRTEKLPEDIAQLKRRVTKELQFPDEIDLFWETLWPLVDDKWKDPVDIGMNSLHPLYGLPIPPDCEFPQVPPPTLPELVERRLRFRSSSDEDLFEALLGNATEPNSPSEDLAADNEL